MPREAEISLNEREFIKQALQEQIRIDRRAFDAFRPLELTFGDEYGVADVQLGKTRVIARVSVDVTTPLPERKFDGIFQIVTEFSPMASPAFEVGRPTDAEVILSRILEKAIRRSNALDTESLCIIAGLKCFALRADVHIIDHDGGLIDASCIAVMAALQHFRRPDVQVEGEKATILSVREREPIPLSILHQPLCVTFSYFEGEIFLVDANLAEEQVRQGEVILTMNKHGEICQIAKYGGATINPLALLNCTNVALQKVKEMGAFIQKRLEEDAKERDAGGLMAELSAENARSGQMAILRCFQILASYAPPKFVRRAFAYNRKVFRKGCTAGPLMVWVGDPVAPERLPAKPKTRSRDANLEVACEYQWEVLGEVRLRR